MHQATRVLSFHSNYRCRNSGDCCTARWPIPVEPDTLARVRAHFAADAAIEQQSGIAILPLTENGCAFHNAHSHQCEIHAALGHDALPLSCRQFPRVSVLEPRGASIALSCYCPTALSMLDDETPIAIIDNARAFPAHGEYSGLDARTSLPPALCPGILMDWDSWWEWERLSIELCNLNETPRQLLARLSAAVEIARTWRPGDGELIDRVRAAFQEMKSGNISEKCSPISFSTRAFLASHVFANWTAHLGEGLRTWLRSIETVVFLLEIGWTIKDIDLWLRHWAEPKLLARVWSEAERAAPYRFVSPK